MKLQKRLALVLLPGFLALTANTHAAAATDSGWYFGANIGQASAKIDRERIAQNLQQAGFTSVSIADDEREFGFKAFGGYQFGRFLALEGGYFDLGEFGFRADTTPEATFSGDLKVRGINLDLVGIAPITDDFSAFARVGANHAEARSSFRASGLSTSQEDRRERDTKHKFGIGLQYDFNDYAALRVEAERYRIADSVGNDGDLDLFSIGVVSRFGPAERVIPVTPAPAPPPPPPQAAPAPRSTPPPRVPSRVVFSADSLFDFDSGAVKAAGKTELDQFADNLGGVTYEVIRVTGHTDRIGSAAYNQTLSLQRAEAVKAYLVQAGGIPVSKIEIAGKGKAEPVTEAGSCGPGQTPAVILCLQPDRRVEVEVTGARMSP